MGDSENSRTTSCAASSVARHVAERDRGAEAAGEGHLGQGDGQAALAQVVAAPDQASADRRVDRPEQRPAQLGVDPRDPAAGLIPDHRPSATRPARSRVMPGQQQDVAGLLQVHRHARRTSGTWPMALISSVGGMARLWPSCVYSLLRLSLPEMNGVP